LGLILSITLKKPAVFFSGFAAAISAYGMFFVVGSIGMLFRRDITFFMLIAFALVLLYLVFRNFAYKKIKAKYLIVYLVLFIILSQSREISQVFYLDYNRYQRDLRIMNSIIYDLGGVVPDKPVIFVGANPHPQPNTEIVGISIFHISYIILPPDMAPLSGQIHRFFALHDFPVTHPGHINLEELHNNAYNMSAWSNDGYIMEFEDYIVVKMG